MLFRSKAADLLIQGGGFGLVAMDLGDTPPEMARRISLTSWFRLRRAVEHTSTVLLTVARRSNAKTCATLMLECARQGTEWAGESPAPPAGQAIRLPRSLIMRGIRVHVARRKPGRVVVASFLCGAV